MGFLKKAFSAVTAPVKAAVSVVSNTAQGNIGDAAKAAVSGVTSLSPIAMAETASGGKLSDLASGLPIIGSASGKFIDSSGKIGGSAGDFSGSDLRTYLREGAKLGAVTVGGYYAAPALGLTGSLTAAGIGSQLASGDIRGGLSSAIGQYVPGEYDPLKGIAQGFLAKPTPFPSYKPSTPISIAGKPISGPNVLMVAGAALAAILVIKKIRKK